MAKEANKNTENPSGAGREKKPYDGRPVPEGYALAPIWLKRDYVEEASYIHPENLTTWRFAGLTFLIGYVAVPPDMYEALKRDCYAQINAYLKKYRAGRCVTGRKKDGSPKLCPKTRRCWECADKGRYERFNPWKDTTPEVPFTELMEEWGCEDQYPSLMDTETEEEKLVMLLRHLKALDPRYYDIVMMRYRDPDISAEDIFEKLNLKSSRGYQILDDCEQECRRYFGLRYYRKKKK